MKIGSAFRTLVLACGCAAAAAAAEPAIVVPHGASGAESLAAREVMRYFYLRTGKLLPVEAARNAGEGGGFVVAHKDRWLVSRTAADAPTRAAIAALGPQQFLLKTLARPDGTKVVLVAGGDGAGVLYGAYRVAERLGVRFYLHGDTVPDALIEPKLPDLDETGRPLFDIRGINPFHDFPEGPDWWNRDDYLAYVAQLAKLRMNFIGLHCYPQGGVGPEPAVWIGLGGDADRRGRVGFSYPAQWASTARPNMWGYAAMKTSDFAGGAGMLFEDDDYGPAVQAGMLPTPQTPEQCNELFDRTAALWAQVGAEARGLGVKTCIGTETPLTIPTAVRERLKATDPALTNAAAARALYEGMFKRIARSCPVDYYWLWTPEDWTWGGNKPGQFEATVADIRAALAALEAVGRPFTLATCGWVLGPQHDRGALDQILPKDCPMSCINRQVGHAPVEPGFANVQGRPKWAIPWMENDPDLVAPQPWVGRMRYDAADARRLGCTGLLGIHWRTKAMGPNVAALAAAAWDQSWVPTNFDTRPVPPPPKVAPVGAHGGTCVVFKDPVEQTEEDAVYQSVRYDMSGYDLEVPNGTYKVTLQFNEPHYTEAGKRVFGAKVQGRTAVEHLDLFAKVGRNKALDVAADDVRVTDGRLKIEFVRETEYPCIAGIVIEGRTADANQLAGGPYVRKINCGGPAWKDYEADTGAPAKDEKGRERAMPAEDFYLDFARANFGDKVAEAAGRILAQHDGVNLPEPSGWLGGPGGVKPEKAPWEQTKARYAFVGELENLRPDVQGAGNLARFDYWLNTYRAMAAMAEAGCLRGELNAAAAAIEKEKDPAAKKTLAEAALEKRTALARVWDRLMAAEIAAADTPGELGTIANLEQHSRLHEKFLSLHDTALAAALGTALPEAVAPSRNYAGTARIVVPAVRTLVGAGEALVVRAILLPASGQPADAAPKEAELCWRPLGKGGFARVPLTLVARRLYQAQLPPQRDGTAIEYYLRATMGADPIVWPAAAPALNQTVLAADAAGD